MRGGGLFASQQGPSRRFNPAEKGMFWWGICMPGIVVVGSSLVLDKLLPGLDDLRGDMQVAHMRHAVASIRMMVFLLGHIDVGTIGTRGACKAMRAGHVNEGWTREHHALWLDVVKAGRIPAQRPAPAGTAQPLGGTTPQA